MREQVRSLEVAAYAEGHEYNLTHVGDPVRLTGTPVSAEFFSVLGARPELGRTFVSGEDAAGNDRYVILSHDLWEQRFAGSANVVGRFDRTRGTNRQIVGVMPANFQFPSPKTEVWVPLHNDSGNQVEYWAGDFMPVIGRLRPGTTLAQATAEIRLFQSRVFGFFPWTMPKAWNADLSVVELRNGMVGNVRTRLLLLLGAVGLMLLIACANVANLMLSRAATREKEMGIRSALGAAPRRIARQLLTESVLLAVIGAVLGFALAGAGLSALKAALPPDTPRLQDVHLDWRVLIFTGALAIFTGLAFGLAPALQSSKAALSEALNSAGRGASVAVSRGAARLSCHRGSGALRHACHCGRAADPKLLGAFRTSTQASVRIASLRRESLLINRSAADVERCVTFYRDVVDQVRSSPGRQRRRIGEHAPSGRQGKQALVGY